MRQRQVGIIAPYPGPPTAKQRMHFVNLEHSHTETAVGQSQPRPRRLWPVTLSPLQLLPEAAKPPDDHEFSKLKPAMIFVVWPSAQCSHSSSPRARRPPGGSSPGLAAHPGTDSQRAGPCPPVLLQQS